MAEPDEDIIATLSRGFISDAAARLEAMDGALGRLANPPPAPQCEDARNLLRFESHRLRGCGASFGFPEITRLAGEMEDYLEGSGSDVAVLGRLMGALRSAVTGDDDPKP